jgi:hypothetical protein
MIESGSIKNKMVASHYAGGFAQSVVLDVGYH